MPIMIRPLERADRARWEELFLAYGVFYKLTLPKDVLDAVWGWIHGGREPFWCDCAIDGAGEIVGIAQYQSMHRSLGGGMTCYLSDLYVEPKCRGAGVGRALIAHVLEVAAKKGYPGVRWLTQDFNYRGRMLYDTFAPKTDFILYNVPTKK